MNPIAFPLAAFLVSIAVPVWSATFSVSCDGKMEVSRRGCTVKLSGEIVAGDDSRLRAMLQRPLQADWTYHTLLLGSPGGEGREAMRLALTVREAMLYTSTVAADGGDPAKTNWACVSACFLVWVAGVERLSYSAAVRGAGEVGIGLHRPYFAPDVYANSPARVAELQQTMTLAVRDYLRREQVPESFTEKMLERSSKEVYWLRESGNPFALNGRANWFEEMMIARCKFDPAYDRDMDQARVDMYQKGQARTDDLRWEAYLRWRREYNACEYKTRREAQLEIQGRR